MVSDPACILFSGGADSTLAAVLAAKEHLPIHLLTFRHCHMSQMEKTENRASLLADRFGDDNVVYRCFDMTPLWKSLGKDKEYCRIRSKGAYALVIKTCIACKAAMHLMAAAYCTQNGIFHLSDGAHPSGSRLFPEQSEGPMEILRTFHENYGINYSSPVYDIERPDFKLHDMGITDKRNTKDEHLYYTNQFACHIGLIPYFYWYAIHPFTGNGNKTVDLTAGYLSHCLIDNPHVSPADLELPDET